MNRMPRIQDFDMSLYLVTDPHLSEGRSLLSIVQAAIKGGAGVVQYRDKNSGTRKMVERAKALCQVCHQSGACFLVNDRVDVALAVDADGVHVGQDDMPINIARALLGPDKLIGITVHNAEEIKAAEEEGVDYLSLAPVFATSTKPDHQTPLGPEGVRILTAKSSMPFLAIGGINHSNAAVVVRAGVEGICVVSAVLSAEDPEPAARELYNLVRATKSGK